MIRRGTWIVIAILLVLVGLSYFLRDRQSKTAEAATSTPGLSPLFDAILGEPSRIRIESTAGQATELARDEDGAWVLHAPEEAEADQAAAQAAATQIGALRILSTVDLAPDIIGLDTPAYTLNLTFNDGSTHSLHIGSITPITDGYYAQLDGGPYQVVDKYGLDELIGLLGTPPYLTTPTAEVTPSVAVSATPVSASPPPAGVTTADGATSPEPVAATATP